MPPVDRRLEPSSTPRRNRSEQIGVLADEVEADRQNVLDVCLNAALGNRIAGCAEMFREFDGYLIRRDVVDPFREPHGFTYRMGRTAPEMSDDRRLAHVPIEVRAASLPLHRLIARHQESPPRRRAFAPG